MTNKIIEAATACGVWVPMGDDKQKDVAALARFYAIARAEALEDAAKKCESMAEDDLGNVGSQCFDCAQAIRKLKEQQHG